MTSSIVPVIPVMSPTLSLIKLRHLKEQSCLLPKLHVTITFLACLSQRKAYVEFEEDCVLGLFFVLMHTKDSLKWWQPYTGSRQSSIWSHIKVLISWMIMISLININVSVCLSLWGVGIVLYLLLAVPPRMISILGFSFPEMYIFIMYISETICKIYLWSCLISTVLY